MLQARRRLWNCFFFVARSRKFSLQGKQVSPRTSSNTSTTTNLSLLEHNASVTRSPNSPSLLHSESQMLLHTKHIRGGLSVHVCYTNDIMAVNRWIRRVIYRDPPINSETELSSSISSYPPITLPLSVGLDVEWKANRSKGEDNHVAVIQLAIRSHILVFHAHLSRLPPGVSADRVRGTVLAENTAAGQSQHEAPLELARIFSDPGIRFVGVGVLNDYLKVVRDLRLSIVPLYQLQGCGVEGYCAKSNDSTIRPLSFSPIKIAPPPTHSFAAERVVEMSEKWLVGRRISEGHGLKALSVRVLSLQGWNSRSSSSSSSSTTTTTTTTSLSSSRNKSDDNGSSINHSQWEQPLSNIQIRYAALDAWSSAVVHDVIERHEQRMPEREELARRAAAKSVRKVLLREIQFGTARLSSAIASGLVSSSASLLDAANFFGNDTVDPTNATFWKEQRLNSSVVKAVDMTQNFSISDPIKISRSELRNAFVAAMNDTLVKSAAEDSLMWFNQGELTQPQVGGIGHNRAKTPFPKLRRRGLSKARICPDPRFIVDVRAVLGEGEEKTKAKGGGLLETTGGNNGGGGVGSQLAMVPLPVSKYMFGSNFNDFQNEKEESNFSRNINNLNTERDFGSFAYLLERMH